jgi:hypothetical protein
MTYKITVPGAKEKFEQWIADRGGILVWPNENLSDPGKGPMFTPATTADGEDGTKSKPHWGVGKPILVKDIGEFEFQKIKELKRFHVAVRLGSQGMSYKLTEAAGRRLKKELAKATEKFGDSWYEFDYCDEKNCVIMVPDNG